MFIYTVQFPAVQQPIYTADVFGFLNNSHHSGSFKSETQSVSHYIKHVSLQASRKSFGNFNSDNVLQNFSVFG